MPDDMGRALLSDISTEEFLQHPLDAYPDTDLNRQSLIPISGYREDISHGSSAKKEEYTAVYGPLCLDDLTEEWEWSKGVWPWEGRGL